MAVVPVIAAERCFDACVLCTKKTDEAAWTPFRSPWLEACESAPQPLKAGDAFVIPPDVGTRHSALSPDLSTLKVTLPGTVTTITTG